MPEKKPKRPKSWSKRFKRFLLLNLGPPFLYLVIRFIAHTSRFTIINAEELIEKLNQEEPVIGALWHNRALLTPNFYRYLGGKKIMIMASRSWEGILASRILKLFGIESTYGSTGKGGKEALNEMVQTCLKGKYNLGITPDGPLGPAEKVKPGAILLAQKTGLPIYPISYYAKRVIRLKSWDRFIIPLPFNHIVAMAGKPIRVPKELSSEQRKNYQFQLEEELKRLGWLVENYFSEKVEEEIKKYSRFTFFPGLSARSRFFQKRKKM